MIDRKPIFDAVKAMLGRGMKQAEVSALDDAITAAETGAPTAAAHTVGPRGIALIKQFEGCEKKRPDGKIEAYPDPGSGCDPWTIGWGATGPGIARGVVWTQQQCDDRLVSDLVKYAAAVSKAIGSAPTTQNQFDALVSFHYNTGAIAKATLTKKHIAGDYKGAKAEFAKWNRAGGRVMAGLTRRRAAEAEVYGS